MRLRCSRANARFVLCPVTAPLNHYRCRLLRESERNELSIDHLQFVGLRTALEYSNTKPGRPHPVVVGCCAGGSDAAGGVGRAGIYCTWSGVSPTTPTSTCREGGVGMGSAGVVGAAGAGEPVAEPPRSWSAAGHPV